MGLAAEAVYIPLVVLLAQEDLVEEVMVQKALPGLSEEVSSLHQVHFMELVVAAVHIRL
jgi:hypothetical protein